MPTFARSFATHVLQEWDAKNPGNAVRALFGHWCLPGIAASGKLGLRLGLRSGYLNFYIKGQSIARLSIARNGPRLSIHKAYVTPRRRKTEADGTPPTQDYQTYDARALADPDTAGLIPGWIETAKTYASAEKCFVDDLIAANPGVIDLEMGLPASNLEGSERVAPRMDLVLAQRKGDEPLSIGFWEAKCANNSELRASGNKAAKVVEQIAKYARWMAQGDRMAEVQDAYRSAACTLLEMNRLFREREGNPECVGIWQALAELETPGVMVQPGIVIGNYWPEGYQQTVASGRMAQCAASFARNGHRDKLRVTGIRVFEVGPDHHGPVLPFLAGAAPENAAQRAQIEGTLK